MLLPCFWVYTSDAADLACRQRITRHAQPVFAIACLCVTVQIWKSAPSRPTCQGCGVFCCLMMVQPIACRPVVKARTACQFDAMIDLKQCFGVSLRDSHL